jgi:hypothetical protein
MTTKGKDDGRPETSAERLTEEQLDTAQRARLKRMISGLKDVIVAETLRREEEWIIDETRFQLCEAEHVLAEWEAKGSYYQHFTRLLKKHPEIKDFDEFEERFFDSLTGL